MTSVLPRKLMSVLLLSLCAVQAAAYGGSGGMPSPATGGGMRLASSCRATARTAVRGARSCPPHCRALFAREELASGDVWTGLVFKLTDYGAFVKLGHEQHIGLVHVKTLSEERLPRESVVGFLEEVVGPVGSKVSCEVLSLEHRGQKQVSLKLLEVVKQQHMEDLVFAPGPRRLRRNGVDAMDE